MSSTSAQPFVTVIVPVRGGGPRLEESLATLLAQDYPDFELVLVTEHERDPARSAVTPLLSTPRARHVIAGPATACGQKNHNLLAGVRAANGKTAIYVFADAGRLAPPGWLKALVAPLANGARVAATSYHHVVSPKPGAAAIARMIVVQFLEILQRTAPTRQVWGGSTALSRVLFEELDVEGLWSHHLVDDVSLARRLKARGIRVAYVREPSMRTPLNGAGWDQTASWLTRQLFYLRCCFPVAWLTGGLAGYAALLLLPLLVRTAPMAAAVYAGLIAALLLLLRRGQPAPPPVWRWLAAGSLVLPAACWCHARSAAGGGITWRGKKYRVARDGRVRSVAEE